MRGSFFCALDKYADTCLKTDSLFKHWHISEDVHCRETNDVFQNKILVWNKALLLESLGTLSTKKGMVEIKRAAGTCQSHRLNVASPMSQQEHQFSLGGCWVASKNRP